jgi:hypothetical protein
MSQPIRLYSLHCLYCDKTFSNGGHLTNHTRRKHSNFVPKTQFCEFCKIYVNDGEHYKMHIIIPQKYP